MRLLPIVAILVILVLFAWLYWITQTTLTLAHERNSHPTGWRGERFALFPGPWWRPRRHWRWAYAAPRPWWYY